MDVPEALADVFADARRRVAGPRAAAPSEAVDPAIVATVDGAERPVVLAGPGVVLDGAVDGLRALAEAGGLGVLNTWGAKGVFDWRSPHHLATAGLQQRDFERGGLADADLIIASGVDEREARGPWRLAPVVEVSPGALATLAREIVPREREIVVPPLRAELAAVTQAGWERVDALLPPTKVTQHYSRLLGDGGLVAADPGIAGYWVARTFATQHLGGAQVTADPDGQGFAVACGVVARLADPGRPVLAVVDRIDAQVASALETAERLGVTVPVEVWSVDGEALEADAHLARLERLLDEGGQRTIATDPHQLDEMLAVAGPIVAWTR